MTLTQNTYRAGEQKRREEKKGENSHFYPLS